MPRDDINYKVALSGGAKDLAVGQLKKAEEQFRIAIKRCAECGAGYRGLAKVFVELEDRFSALNTLREGAQILARAGNRAEAIDLLRDAVRLAPEDLGLHRRYAAALANAGNTAGAVAEYDRYVTWALARNDLERARMEVGYAHETLGQLDGLAAIERRVAERLPKTEPETPSERPRPAPVGSAPAEPPQTGVEYQPFEELVKRVAGDPRERALVLDARAQELLARSDAQSGAVALEAARSLLDQGMQHAAGDLLLQLVSSGQTDRDVQRLLVDIAKTLGRGEIARDKCLLLAAALRLDGRPDAATEVERLAAV